VSHATGMRQSLKVFVAASIDGSDSRGAVAPRKVRRFLESTAPSVLGRISRGDAPGPTEEATARFPPGDTHPHQSGRAPSFPRTPFISMAISRILFPGFLRGDDHLSRQACAERPPNRRRRSMTAATVWRDATIPEDLADRLSFLCFVLHRMGFFLPRRLRVER